MTPEQIEMAGAALDALLLDLPSSAELDAAELCMSAFGRALRAGLPLPSAAARWLEALPTETLAAIAERPCCARGPEASAWLLRAAREGGRDPDYYSEVVRQHELAQDIRAGLRRSSGAGVRAAACPCSTRSFDEADALARVR